MVHYFNICVHPPIAQQPGQAVVQGRLSRNECLWLQYGYVRYGIEEEG
jgi:hypothetical protein